MPLSPNTSSPVSQSGDAPPSAKAPQRWAPSADLIAVVSRFGLVGLANTALGLGVITALDLGLGVNRQLANAFGYGAGMILSFVLNRKFVFRSRARSTATAPRFIAALAISFALNQAVLYVAARVMGHSAIERLAAQMVAMGSYTVTFFLLCRLWVFAGARAAEVQEPGSSRPS